MRRVVHQLRPYRIITSEYYDSFFDGEYVTSRNVEWIRHYSKAGVCSPACFSFCDFFEAKWTLSGPLLILTTDEASLGRSRVYCLC